MNSYITIDGGTTNTRVCLVRGEDVLKCIKGNVGAGHGEKEEYYKFIRDAAGELFDVCTPKAVIASGMITSAGGLFEVPHISAPAGMAELCGGIQKKHIPYICDMPISFIPGVKKTGTDFKETDIMRGEETELAGLFESFETECAYILPGSHSKCIMTDRDGRISDFFSFLTGEMIAAVMENTILKKSIEYTDIQTDALLCGFDTCDELGINEALFKARILDTSYKEDKSKIFSYYTGVMLHDEVKRICGLDAKKYIIGGRGELRNSEALLIEHFGKKNVLRLSDDICKNAAAIGAVRIYGHKQGR